MFFLSNLMSYPISMGWGWWMICIIRNLFQQEINSYKRDHSYGIGEVSIRCINILCNLHMVATQQYFRCTGNAAFNTHWLLIKSSILSKYSRINNHIPYYSSSARFIISIAIFVALMMTSSNGNIFALLTICAGNTPVTGEFPAQRPVTRSFEVFFDLRPNKRLSK